METTTVLVSSLFSNEIQYIIPLFQRHYVWDEENQWQPLWEDIKEKVSRRVSEECTDKRSTHHFTGAIVIQQRGVNVNEVKKYEIIDGQQRLTTFQIILCAIRDICEEHGYDDILGRTERYIRNEEDYNSNDEQYKLIPTEYDRNAFISLIDKESDNSSWYIQQAYRFFRSKITDYVDDDKKKIQILFRSILEDFALVQIRLDPDDQPEKIFESLNARGKDLLQFDLLRNNLFLRARVEEDRDQLYKNYWAHFEKPYWEGTVTVARKKITRSELFFQHFIMAKFGEENVTPLFNVYQRKVVGNRGVLSELIELKKYSETYEELINCSPDSEIGQSMLFYKIFGITTLHPFILFAINELEVSGSDLSKILHILESYTVRRLLCLKTQGTKNYTKLFSRLIRELKGKSFNLDDFIDRISEEKANATRCPTDFEVENHLTTWRAYEVNENIMRYILYQIELMKRKENQLLETDRLDLGKNLTLEHIMPKKWAATWILPLLKYNEDGNLEILEKTVMYKDLFSNEYKADNPNWETELNQDSLKQGLTDKSLENTTFEWAMHRKRNLYSIGNLTLVTGRLNSSLSNDTFLNKKEKLFQNSLLMLNKGVCEYETWDWIQIDERATEMFTFFCKIWPSLEHFREGVT